MSSGGKTKRFLKWLKEEGQVSVGLLTHTVDLTALHGLDTAQAYNLSVSCSVRRRTGSSNLPAPEGASESSSAMAREEPIDNRNSLSTGS